MPEAPVSGDAEKAKAKKEKKSKTKPLVISEEMIIVSHQRQAGNQSCHSLLGFRSHQ